MIIVRFSILPPIAGALWLIIAAFFATMNVVTVFAPASNDTDTAGVSVTVNNQTIINIVPSNWTISSINPGSAAVNTSFSLENLGSANITLIWASVSQPTSNPFGGSASGFNAGNYIALRNYTGVGGSQDGKLNLVDILEYNMSKPSYVTTPATCGTTFGKIRNSSYEYFWCLTNSTGNVSNNTIIIGRTPHSDTQLGTIDLSGSDTDTITLNSGAATWGANDVTGTIPTTNPLYPGCIRVQNDTSAIGAGQATIRMFKWNADIIADCTAIPYIFINSLTNYFGAGQILPLDIAVFVPYGASAGSMSMGILTIIAQ